VLALAAALLLVALAGPVAGSDPLDPVPATYCSDNDRVFWFVVITDTHIGASGSQPADYLEWTVTRAKGAINPAFIVLSGDITDSTNCVFGECGLFGWPDGPHEEEWQLYRQALCLDCAAPHVNAEDFFDIPGNHDQYNDGNFTYYLANSVQGKATGRAQASWTRSYDFGTYHFLGLQLRLRHLSLPRPEHGGERRRGLRHILSLRGLCRTGYR
jgi:hypothetical protein